jgi:hypothetical protein
MASHTIMAPTQPELSQQLEVEEPGAASGLITLEHYRPFFREIDLDVLKLFSIDKVLF